MPWRPTSSSTFTTVAAAPSRSTCGRRRPRPRRSTSGDTQAIELGVKFTASTTAYITGVQFYKAAANTGRPHRQPVVLAPDVISHGRRSPANCHRLADARFHDARGAHGRHTYVASYHTTTGHYSVNRSYFTSPFTSGR